jgi:hypothetical protein
MKRPLRVIRNDWRPNEGVVLFITKDGAGRDVSISVPIEAVRSLASHARRFLASKISKPGELPGGWHSAELSTVQTFDVGQFSTTEGEKVSLVLDRGLENEIGFAFPSSLARELGERLIGSADRTAGTSKSKPH